MNLDANKHIFSLIFTLSITPFILFLGKNFLQTEFFTIEYFQVVLLYCLLFLCAGTYFFFYFKKGLFFLLFCAYLSFLQFYYFDIQQFVKTILGEEKSTGKYVLLLIVLISFIATFISRFSIFRNFVLILLFLNITLSFYHLIPSIGKSLKEVVYKKTVIDNSSIIKSSTSNIYPNIFYIVPDTLASPKVLKDYVDIDFQDSIKEFEKKGFVVPVHNYSSYNMTRWSLAALFYMDYPVTGKIGNILHYPTIRENNPKLLKYLKKYNYKFIIAPPIWGGCPVSKDYRCLTPKNNSFPSNLLQDYAVKTIFQYSLIRKILEIFSYKYNIFLSEDMDDAGKTVLNKMKTSPELWSEGGVFTMIHMMIPHTPYRDKNCSITNDYIAPSKNGYKSTVYCALSRIHDLSDFIIKNYPNATIVVQSDHGVDPVIISDDKKFEDISELSIDYRLSNFTAVKGCNSQQAANLNQAKIVNYVVECLVNGISVKQTENRSFWGFYRGPDYGKLFPVSQK